jgi:two-component system, LuxR family, response regulator FixJ
VENPRPFIVHIVDDDDAVRDSMRALLESYGVEVDTYGSAGEFLRHDLVLSGCLLLDLHMPGISGLELLNVLRSRNSQLPIIAMTGRSDAALKERVVRAGALTLLEKPVPDETLLSSLECAFSLSAPAQGR